MRSRLLLIDVEEEMGRWKGKKGKEEENHKGAKSGIKQHQGQEEDINPSAPSPFLSYEDP